jgi:hypothetical protein
MTLGPRASAEKNVPIMPIAQHLNMFLPPITTAMMRVKFGGMPSHPPRKETENASLNAEMQQRRRQLRQKTPRTLVTTKAQIGAKREPIQMPNSCVSMDPPAPGSRKTSMFQNHHNGTAMTGYKFTTTNRVAVTTKV